MPENTAALYEDQHAAEPDRVEDESRATPITPNIAANLIKRHHCELNRFVSRKLGTQEPSADILQEAYLRLINQPTAESIANPRAFVFRIVANLVVDYQRRSVNRLPHDADEQTWLALPDSQPDPEHHYQNQQKLAAINAAMAELPENCRLAFYLNRVEGHNHADIARRMHISESMVAKHLVRAMQHCRDRLKHY